jgi:hypothetical protein
MKPNIIAQITKAITKIQGCQFASLTYLSKKHGELARYTANFGFSYHQIVEKSVTALEILISENETVWDSTWKLAAAELLESFKNTLAAHARGEQNEAYTKKDQYIPLGGGANLNTSDNSIQLFGLVLTKKVLVEGVYPKVNSAPKTIAKNKIRKMLPVGNFREFAIDLSQVEQMKINGNTIEIPDAPAAGYSFQVNPATPAAQPVSV